MIVGLSGCMTSTDDPIVKDALKNAQTKLYYCIRAKQVDIDDGTQDAALLARVIADQCQSLAVAEAKKLRSLNANPSYIEGFIKLYTSKSEIEDRALTTVMTVRAKIYQDVAEERRAKRGLNNKSSSK